MPRQWKNQENVKILSTHHGNIQRGKMQANGVFPGTFQRPTSLYPYSTQARKGTQNFQGKVCQAQNPEHRNIVLIKFMVKFLQKYATHYFAKVLIAGNKTVKYLPKYGGNLHGKRDMCMH